MTLSMNEIEAAAKKAARGAGYPWGLAEEAGKATRWLCSRDVDGCRALAGLLERIDGKDIAGWSPQTGNGRWTAKDGLLCPLATGAAISDRADEFGATGIRMGAIAYPVLLAPFIAYLASASGRAAQVSVSGSTIRTDGVYLRCDGTPPHASARASTGFCDAVDWPDRLCQRADPDPRGWSILLAFAHRTYAPASRESRLRGAGAGLSDND